MKMHNFLQYMGHITSKRLRTTGSRPYFVDSAFVEVRSDINPTYFNIADHLRSQILIVKAGAVNVSAT